MNENLTNFLVGLVSDPDRLARFNADPAAALDGAHLTKDESAAVLSRDSGRIRRALGLSAADHMTQMLHTMKPKARRNRR